MFYINFFKTLLKNFNIKKISIYQRPLYTEVLILNHDFGISRVDCTSKIIIIYYLNAYYHLMIIYLFIIIILRKLIILII